MGLSQRIDSERREMAAMGEARRLVQLLVSRGHTIALEGDNITVSPRPDDETAARLRRAKPELLMILRSEPLTRMAERWPQ